MSERLTKRDVAHIAALAHLELTDEEADLFTRQLADILTYAGEIQNLDTTGIAPTSHVLTEHTVDRLDAVGDSLALTDALANAPDPARQAGLFKVPRVIG